MNGIIAPLLCAIAGICILTAAQYFLLAWRKWRRPAHVSLACLALCIAGFELATLISYRAASIDVYVTATRCLADFGCLAGICTVWFATYYSNRRVDRICWGLTGILTLLLVLNHLLPAGVILEPGGELSMFALPWGEAIARVRGQLNPWSLAYYGAFVLVAIHCLVAGRVVMLAGRKRRGLALGLGASFMAVMMASDVLMERQAWEFLYFSDYAFLPLVMIMNVALVGELVESNVRLGRLTDASFESIFFTRDRRIFDVNTQLCQMFGRTRSGIVGQPGMDLIAPQQRQVVEAWLGTQADGTIETLGLRGDGTVFPIELRTRGLELEGRKAYVTVIRDISERQAALAALAASEEKYAKLFRNSPDAIAITRIDVGLILEVNERFAELTGYAREEVLGRTTVELGLWANPGDRIKLIDQMNATGPLRDVERELRRKDGSTRTILMALEPIELGGESCVIAILHDISERKLAELTLRASEERFDLAVRGTTDGVWDWDIVKNTVYYAPRFTALLGLSPENFPPNLDSFFQRLHPADDVRVRAAVEAHLKAGDPYDVAFRLRTSEETYRWFRSRGEAVRTADGTAVRVVGSLSDIHEHRLAEEALRRSEAEFRAIFEGSAIGIALITTDGCIQVCNPALCQLLGYTSEEICQRAYGEKTHPDDVDRDRALYRELLSGERTFVQDEKRYLRKDGRIVWGRRTVSVVPGDDGRPRCAIGMVEDITERKEAEESLRLAQHRELQAHAEFSHRLLTAQEQERKRLATELHDSLGQHLSIIKNRAMLAREQIGTPSPGAPHLDNVIQVTADVINEVRNLAHRLRPVHIDQFGLISSLELLLDQIAGSTLIVLEHRLENVDDLLRGEAATHVYRIMQEALNNLLKHSRATHARVVIERDIRCIRLRIEDDGCGFDLSTTRSLGAGLGVTSIRERVAMLGGTARWLSAPGAGTRLWIELPLADGV